MSKSRLFGAVKALDLGAVRALLDAHPALHRCRDQRGRNALHLLCSRLVPARDGRRALSLARYLLSRGFAIDDAAFVEDEFRATPLWFAIARGRKLSLARLLLDSGSTPEHCLWAAAFLDDVRAIDLLVGYGARVDPVSDGETPFLGAVKWSHFAAAERLLRHGANVDFQDANHRTALHLVLKKRSDRRHVQMLLRHGANPHVKDRQGHTAIDMVAKRRDRTWLDLLSAGTGDGARTPRARRATRPR